MKNFFKICIVLLALSGKMYSQNWLWSKSQNINSVPVYGGNVRLSSSGNLVSYFYDFSGSELVYTNKDGDVIWNKSFSNLQIRDIVIDASDNIYFAGGFTGNVTISGNPMARFASPATGIEKLTLNNSVSIYPNPATGMITISCNSGIKSGCTLIIKNASGQLVYLDPIKETSSSFIREVDLGFAPRGAYFVEVESNYERTSKTVILH